MSRFKLKKNKFGEHDTILLYDEETDYAAEIALQGSTLLNFTIPINDVPFNIIDGFATPRELEAARGARCWILAPFANRIPNGEYEFEGKKYKFNPIPPRNNVIHGFAAYQLFKLTNVNASDEFIEAELLCDAIRPGKFEGYPFSLNISTKIKLEDGRLSMSIIGENLGTEPLPFHCGWHPYFRTSLAGIDNLILETNAKTIIKLDDNFIPLEDDNAYEDLKNFPEKDFTKNKNEAERIIGKKVLNDCYHDLNLDKKGIAVSSIKDMSTGIEFEIFQEGGVTLVFTGEGLAQRERKSIAVEPMQFITNAFNRTELKEKIKVLPGKKSVFNFGVKVKNI